MKQKLSLLTAGLVAFGLSPQIRAQDTPAPAPTSAKPDSGPQVNWNAVTEIQVTNLDGESLGRIYDLALDLSTGHIAEVLVVYDQFMRFGGKIVAVPPRAFMPTADTNVYQVNMSPEAFKAAPEFNPDKWAESTQPDKVEAAYKYFGQRPYFLVPGPDASRVSNSGRVRVPLGTLEKMRHVVNMNVVDVNGARVGRLQTLTLDVPNGRILNVFLVDSYRDAGKPLTFATDLTPSMLSLNAADDGLILDMSKTAYKEEPHVIFQNGGGGPPSTFADGKNGGGVNSYTVQPATSSPASPAPVQGTSSSDINTTAAIYKSIQSGNLDAANKVEVATLDGRVILSGTVNTQATKDSIGAIAVGVVNPDNVNNQIVVLSQAQASL
jgi:sporulation protein YlmC with PRC-barrel domain